MDEMENYGEVRLKDKFKKERDEGGKLRSKRKLPLYEENSSNDEDDVHTKKRSERENGDDFRMGFKNRMSRKRTNPDNFINRSRNNSHKDRDDSPTRFQGRGNFRRGAQDDGDMEKNHISFSDNSFKNRRFKSLFLYSRMPYNEIVTRLFTFKEFVLTLDEHVYPEDAVDNYYDYVQKYADQQVLPFFNNYKDCDWLLLKYHPQWKFLEFDFIKKCIQVRLVAFMTLFNTEHFENICLDFSKRNSVIIEDFLAYINILLEGGSMEDVQAYISTLESSLEDSDRSENFKSDSEDSSADSSDKSSKDGSEDDKNTTLDRKNRDFDDGYVEKNIKTAKASKVLSCHRVVSFFVRQIPVDIGRSELFAAYEPVDGFLRVYLSEPNLGKRDYRRCHITFKAGTNADETLQNLNQIKIRDRAPLIARLSTENVNKVKAQDNKYSCKSSRESLVFDMGVVKSLIEKLEKKYFIFEKCEIMQNSLPSVEKTENDGGEDGEQEEKIKVDILKEINNENYEKIVLPKANPVLEALSKLLDNHNESSDSDIKKVLDRAILYLRIVFSIDYYGLQEYSYEHLRSVRCGTITLRNVDSDSANIMPATSSLLHITPESIFERYCSEVNEKLKSILNDDPVSDEKARLLGLKDSEKEVEQFIETNTQKIAEEKYLCPLSMKKFKSADYVRKHILLRHTDKLNHVRKETEFFNNYLRDKYRNLPFSIQSLKRYNKANSHFHSNHDVSNQQKENKEKSNHQQFKSRKPFTYKDFDCPGTMFDL